MSYLECSEQDCCHNKGGCCCLGEISVHHTGERSAVCRSYRCNESVGNVASDNPPPSTETEVRCDDCGCVHNEERCCCASRVDIKECSCGPACATRTDRGEV